MLRGAKQRVDGTCASYTKEGIYRNCGRYNSPVVVYHSTVTSQYPLAFLVWSSLGSCHPSRPAVETLDDAVGELTRDRRRSMCAPGPAMRRSLPSVFSAGT